MTTQPRRANGAGTISQRKDGSWCAALRLPDGRRKYFYAQTQDAVAKRLAVALAIQRGDPDMAELRARVTALEATVTQLQAELRKQRKPRRQQLPGFVGAIMLDAYANHCAYCVTELNPLATHIDHVIPLSRGGTDHWSNLVPACATCNRKKAAMTLDEADMHLHTAAEVAVILAAKKP